MIRDKEKFFELVEKYKDYLTIVEGKKDKEALEKLGFKKVKVLNKALYKIIEEVDEEKVVILTDLDKKGKQLYRELSLALRSRGVFVDDMLRNFLFRNSKIRCVEGLRKL